MVSYDDPDYDPDDGQMASFEMLSYFMAMAEERKESPADDIVTKLVTADIDGEELTSDEFGFFTILLSVAGNETTRNAISHGMIAFMEHPEQWEIYKRERPETAADEIVRWSTPVVAFQRTARGHRDRRPADQGRPAGRHVLRGGELRPDGLRRTRTSSTSCATRTRTWASAAPARTTASARTWPGWRST